MPAGVFKLPGSAPNVIGVHINVGFKVAAPVTVIVPAVALPVSLIASFLGIYLSLLVGV